MTSIDPTTFLGLAPFLRMNIAGVDLRPTCEQMLAMLATTKGDLSIANLWMNLSIAMQCLGQRDLGLAYQAHALTLNRVYHLASSRQPAKLRLLLLVVPGDLAANTPLDCLLENSDIDLDFYYVSPGTPLALPIPEHDVLMVAMSEADENHELLASLEAPLRRWSKPVLNAPQNIPTTGRMTASRLLQDAPGLLIPPTLQASRPVLQEIAAGAAFLPVLFEGCDFPIILRPVGSHAGHDLSKLECAAEVATYLSRVEGAEFYLSRFIDYSSIDGLFRKFRVALVDGVPFACHMGISSSWMIHYLNAGMYEDAQKRAEEASFMTHFDDFAERHGPALEAIYKRSKLDYVCVDCGETREGELLVFEIDHAMVVHAMDSEDLFPHKQHHMQKVQDAFRDFLLDLTSSG